MRFLFPDKGGKAVKLLLIRHAEPADDGGLTEKGKREAELLAERISFLPVSAFYVSPLQRAAETAEPILQKTGRKADTLDWLREFEIPTAKPDWETLSPVPWNWLPEDWLAEARFLSAEHWQENEIFRSAGVGEAYKNVITAFDAFLSEHGYIREGRAYRACRANTDTLALVTHFGLSCVLMSHLFNCSPMILWHSLMMAPSSVTTIFTEERQEETVIFRAAAIGDVSHLTAAGEEPSSAGRFAETYINEEH